MVPPIDWENSFTARKGRTYMTRRLFHKPFHARLREKWSTQCQPRLSTTKPTSSNAIYVQCWNPPTSPFPTLFCWWRTYVPRTLTSQAVWVAKECSVVQWTQKWEQLGTYAFIMLTITIVLLRWTNSMNIAQKSWVGHHLPFSCHWTEYLCATQKCFVMCFRDVTATALYCWDEGTTKELLQLRINTMTSPSIICQSQKAWEYWWQ